MVIGQRPLGSFHATYVFFIRSTFLFTFLRMIEVRRWETGNPRSLRQIGLQSTYICGRTRSHKRRYAGMNECMEWICWYGMNVDISGVCWCHSKMFNTLGLVSCEGSSTSPCRSRRGAGYQNRPQPVWTLPVSKAVELTFLGCLGCCSAWASPVRN